MRVAFVTGGFPSKENPMHGIFNYRAVKGIKEFVDIEVFRIRMWRPFVSFKNSYELDDIKVHEFFIPLPPYTKYSLKLQVLLIKYFGWQLIKNDIKSFDIIHSVGASVSGIASAYWAQMTDVHHVTQVIGSDLIFQLPRLKNLPFVKGWTRWVHGVSCNTNFLKNLFQKNFPDVPNVEAIYRGTDLETFTPEGPGLDEILSLNGTRFLFVGGFPNYPDIPYGDNLKGGRTILKAWEIVDSEVENSTSPPVFIIGGPFSDTPEIRRWKNSLKHPDRVKILGKINPLDMPNLYRSVNVLLLPSLSEGMPNAAVEASASGVPVFGSKVDGVPELIKNGYNGLLIPPGIPEEWAKAILTYYDKLDLLKAMGRNAREFVEKKFDARNFPIRMVRLYRKALEVKL